MHILNAQRIRAIIIGLVIILIWQIYRFWPETEERYVSCSTFAHLYCVVCAHFLFISLMVLDFSQTSIGLPTSPWITG